MQSIKDQFHFLSTYFKSQKKIAFLALFFVFVSTALDQVSPLMIKFIVDHLNEGGDMQGVIPWLVVLALSSLTSAVMLFYQRYLLICASRQVEYDLRNDLFKLFQEQPHAFFSAYRTGDLMSRATNDLNNVRDLIGPVVLHSFRMALLFIYTAAMMVWLSPIVALVGLGMALLLPFLSLRFMRMIYKTYADNQQYLGELNTFVQESFSNISVIKSFHRQTWFQNRFSERSLDFRDSSKKIAFTTSLIWPAVGVVSGLGICFSIYVGTYMVDQGKITVGALSALILYLVRVQFPLVGLGWVMSLVQRGRAALTRIMEIVEKGKLPDESGLKENAIKDFSGIRLNKISIELDGQTLLQNIDIDLQKGKSLGIVGETGSGKTLLTRVLTGVLPPNGGEILLNKQPYSDFKRNNLKSHFSISPQDGFLFSLSIRENIEMGQQEESFLTVEEASKLACLDQDLPQIEGGLDAMLGEKGINLSGGQKQRVGLARALLSPAPVIVLDDTLSALDTHTEAKIRENFRTIKNKTQVLVAHRYRAVAHCDEIIYLEKGQIIERGTHEELVALGQKYAKTWQRQLVEMEDEND